MIIRQMWMVSKKKNLKINNSKCRWYSLKNSENKIVKKAEVKVNNEKAREKEEKDKTDEAKQNAVLPPKYPDGPGEMSKPYKVDKEKVDNETKLLECDCMFP